MNTKPSNYVNWRPKCNLKLNSSRFWNYYSSYEHKQWAYMSLSVFLWEALSNLKLAKHVYNLIRSWNSPQKWQTSFRSKKKHIVFASIFTLQYDAVMLNVSNNPCNQYQAYKAWEVLYQILLESLFDIFTTYDKHFTNKVLHLFSHNWVQLTVLEAPNDHLCYVRWTSTKCNPTETCFSSYELICILPGDSDSCSFFSSLVW